MQTRYESDSLLELGEQTGETVAGVVCCVVVVLVVLLKVLL